MVTLKMLIIFHIHSLMRSLQLKQLQLILPSQCVLKQFIVTGVMIKQQWLEIAGAVMIQLSIFQHRAEHQLMEKRLKDIKGY